MQQSGIFCYETDKEKSLPPGAKKLCNTCTGDVSGLALFSKFAYNVQENSGVMATLQNENTSCPDTEKTRGIRGAGIHRGTKGNGETASVFWLVIRWVPTSGERKNRLQRRQESSFY